ncbi:hypothetical protein GAO09_18965 [Rhizobiales bacterium RZME27]|jgi:hypothetical protein|uniref:Uncharacterized protein n=1 Tax=Endobacterium cereale TaxID=2663029 RepID=A0A6A8ABN0_9HYPH|nr:hypothetical protein [Endobacterium cereale]MEB2848267.1 hypothetical protein [Endobacterium cereale]MQY48124.1 hypothetical protein [Endobacterium cereale]
MKGCAIYRRYPAPNRAQAILVQSGGISAEEQTNSQVNAISSALRRHDASMTIEIREFFDEPVSVAAPA